MTRTIPSLAAALVASAFLSAPLLAQTTPPPATPPATTTAPPPATTTAPPPASSEPTTADKIKKMTKDQWTKLRAEWAKDKTKYTGCRDKAKADGLKGRKRWAAIYDCMTAQ